jgi:ankyrin repeat protein
LFEKLKEKCQGNADEPLPGLLNSYDEYGCALIHYIAALNYHELVHILNEYGANLSLKTGTKRNQLTPLMIAAAKGHEKTVKKLMRLGASLMHSSSMKLPPTSSNHKASASIEGPAPIRINRHSSGNGSQRRHSEDDPSNHHQAAINLAMKNKYPIIAEMILRDITLKDAVQDDGTKRSTMLSK